MPALRESWGYSGPRSAFDADTWHAYEVLQAVDLMSLGLALADLSRPASAEPPLRVAATLGRIDQPPGPRIVEAVPVAAGADRVDLTLSVIAPGRVQVEPYPFAEPELTLTLRFRDLDDRIYPSAAETAEAFRAAPPRELTITLVAGSPAAGAT